MEHILCCFRICCFEKSTKDQTVTTSFNWMGWVQGRGDGGGRYGEGTESR